MGKPSPALAAGSGSVAAGKVAPCCSKVDMKRGAWTTEEDEQLASFVRREGEGKWRTMPKRAGLLRNGKSCRLRWMNYLRPSVKRGQIAPDEEDLILRLHRLLGNRWSLIAGRLPGRTDNDIKNYWNTHLSKKLISQGIDPRTHKPLNTNKTSSSVEKNNNALASPVPAGNPNPIPNVLLQKASSSLGQQDDDVNLNMVIHEDHDNLSDRKNNFGNRGRWHSSDGTTARAWSYTHVAGDAVEISDMDCCTDDVFSSFLDSLINDDMFQEHLENNGSSCSTTHNVDLAAPLDAPVSEDPAFGDLSFLEPAAICSTTFNNEGNYEVQSENHMDKQR